jgi:hypothetical protein
MKDRLAETRVQQQNMTSDAETPERKQTDKEAEQTAVVKETARHVQATPGTSNNRAEANEEKAKVAER